jgi:GWxTD domain-containing protein
MMRLLLLLLALLTTPLAAQRTARDTAQRVTQLLTEARTQLTAYEGHAHRRIAESNDADTLRSLQQLVSTRVPPEFRPVLDPSPADLFWAATIVLSQTRAVPLVAAGVAAYQQANEAAAEAYALAPRDARTMRMLLSVLLTQDRWVEVEGVARTHTTAAPQDAWGWMALGLAHARQRRMTEAKAAFDQAVNRLSAADWQRLDRLERVMAPREAKALAKADATTRADTERNMWFLADPLWSSDDEQPRLEFLARVAYAELRWSEPEERLVGADTDRGRIYVRYGPPSTIARLDFRPPDNAAGRFAAAGITIYWVYESGLVFAFTGNTRYARQRLAFDDAAVVASITEREPARWDNIATRRIDSLPVQFVRFRAGPDSTELFVAARAPLARLTEVQGARLDARVWLIGKTTPDMAGAPLRVANDGLAAWARTVPVGEYLWRGEIVTVGEATAARATAPVLLIDDPTTGYLRRGFGISDVLIGTAVGEAKPLTRWRDAGVLPLTGALRQREAVGLVWETYDLAPRNGQATYTVTVTITAERRGTSELSATVVGPLAATAGVERKRDATTIRYERAVAHSPVIADQLTLDLRALPAGSYRLSVEVRDRATGRATVRQTGITIQ